MTVQFQIHKCIRMGLIFFSSFCNVCNADTVNKTYLHIHLKILFTLYCNVCTFKLPKVTLRNITFSLSDHGYAVCSVTNIMIKKLAPPYHIHMNLGSNLNLEKNYPDWGSPQSNQANARVTS